MRVPRLTSKTRRLFLTTGLVLISVSSAMGLAGSEREGKVPDLQPHSGTVTAVRIEADGHERDDHKTPCVTPG